jgi:hypothetical protein
MDEIDLIDKVEALLRKKLNGVYCAICGYYVVGYERWVSGHSPYIEVSGDEIIAGYRCKKDPDNPVIVFRISRSRSGRGGVTTVYE